MAKWKRDRAPMPERRPNALIAASERMFPDQFGNLSIPREAWQTEAWRQFKLNGKLQFAATWKGNSYSRCRLVVVDVGPSGQILGETENAQAIEIGAGFGGNPAKQTQMLRNFGPHLTVAGDCYVVARVDPRTDEFVEWQVYSSSEIRPAFGGAFIVDTGDGNPRTYNLKTDAILIRVYRPDPERSFHATSPTRGALADLREDENLRKYGFAVMDSRLATAGFLKVPSGLEFPSPGDDIKPGESPLMAYLGQVMMASIADRNSAAAVVPIVVQGPKEELAALEWITAPNTELSVAVSQMREDATKNLALALDMPPEILLGMGSANDWSTASLEEASVKLYIEPDMALICDALTEGYLNAALEAAGLDQTKFAYWYDPAELILRPNRSLDAKDAFDRNAIGSPTLRRELGFTELDAPVGDEKCLRGILEVLKASPQSGDMLVQALIKVLGLEECGVTPEMLSPVEADPAGGTPPKDPNSAPDQLPVLPGSAPDPGRRGNKGV